MFLCTETQFAAIMASLSIIRGPTLKNFTLVRENKKMTSFEHNIRDCKRERGPRLEQCLQDASKNASPLLCALDGIQQNNGYERQLSVR